MDTDKIKQLVKGIALPEGVSVEAGKGGLPLVRVKTRKASAEIYFHGAHVAHFQAAGQAPLLWLSAKSKFDDASPIRGGIPVIFPWFGAREGKPAHGFARVKSWDLLNAKATDDGKVKLHFHLPECPERAEYPVFTLDYFVTVGDFLELQLATANLSKDREFDFEECLHTYFSVGNIDGVSVSGLKGTNYLDKVLGFSEHTETNDAIRFTKEVDRVYVNTTAAVEIHDEKLRRKTVIETEGTNSTVVWNPWIEKAKAMPDYGDEEYHEMVCVESGNVSRNRKKLAPGSTSTITVKLSNAPLP